MSLREAVAKQVERDETSKYEKERQEVWKALNRYLKSDLLTEAGITVQTPTPSKMEAEAWYFRVDDVNFRVKYGYLNYDHAWYVYAKRQDKAAWRPIWNPGNLLDLMQDE